MIPVGVIVAAAMAASRAANRKSGGGTATPPQRFRWLALIWIFIAPFAITHVVLLATGDLSWLTAPLLAVEMAVLFPWWFATLVLVPLRLPRLAFVVGAMSDLYWTLDHRGGGGIAGALAILGSPRLDNEAAAWIEKRIAKGKVLKSGGIAATGLLAAARGDLDGARGLLKSVEAIDPKVCAPRAVKLACEWLAADAAARGDWQEAEKIGRSLGPRTRVTRFVAAAAARIRGESWPPSDLRLVLRWIFTAKRRGTFPLLRRALSVPATMMEAEPSVPVEVSPRGDRVADALALHAAILGRSRTCDADLRALGAAWDAVQGDDSLRRHLDERALVLGASNGGSVLDRLQLTVEDDLMALARARDLPLGELAAESATLASAARRLRDELLTEIETVSDAIAQRVIETRALAPIDEWREFLSLRSLYERGAKLGGMELRRLAFPKVHTDGCKLAVWLWNIRKEKAIGNAVFRWLLIEAEALEDSRAIELERENVACGSGT